MSHILTIAIPTFNRNRQLLHNVSILAPQLVDETKLIVFDNASDIPAEDTLKDFLLNPHIAINRNKTNIGAVGNIIKCIEGCSTEWIWILGDDDYPFKNGVATALEHIKKWPEASYINFKSFMSPARESETIVYGGREFVEKLDYFGNVLCISLGLYNVNKLYKGLRFAYQYGYSLAPQIAFLLTGLQKGQAVFSTSEIIDFATHDTGAGGSWSWVTLSTVIGSLAELPLNLDAKTFKSFSEHLLTHIQRPEQLYEILIKDKHYTPKEKLRFFKLIYDRSTFGKLICERTPSFCKYYIKLWIYSLRNKQANEMSDDDTHYKRIERI
jgi:glycosyltransferase involved in cell wall biosynthesis